MAAMPAPDHSALELQHLGYSIIPLAPQDKRPYLRILPGGWSEYQRHAPSDAQVQQWINVGDARMGWGLVCGKVSGSAYCLDVDDLDLAHWVLEHAGEALFHGALIVESGSGKAHIWIRSQTPMRSSVWTLGQGRKAGDIRGEGSGSAGPSYMVVPPSLHPDTGRPYRIRAGSFAALPWLPDGADLAREIVAQFLADGGGYASANGTVGAPSQNKRILHLSDADIANVVSRVRALRLKKKIVDSLLVPGHGAPGSPAWSLASDPSGSGIDFAVCCELIRRDQTLDEVEEIFAATYIGDNRYRVQRGSYGHAYIALTYAKAKEQVDKERQAARQATGTNFTVLEVVRRDRGQVMEFVIRCSVILEAGKPPVEVTVRPTMADLRTEMGFRDKCMVPPIPWVPEFQPSQRGQNWGNFQRALFSMVSDIQAIPIELTDEGFLAQAVENMLGTLPETASRPTMHRQVNSIGWAFQGSYYLFPDMLSRRLRMLDRTMDATKLHYVLNILGHVEIITYPWQDHRPAPLLKLTPRPQSVPNLPMLPAPSA